MDINTIEVILHVNFRCSYLLKLKVRFAFSTHADIECQFVSLSIAQFIRKTVQKQRGSEYYGQS